MAQTTTGRNACDVVVSLDDAAGVLQDISGSSVRANADFTNNIGEFRTFGSQWLARLCCGSDANFSVDVVFSTTDDEGWHLLKNWFFAAARHCTPRSLQIDVPDDETSSDRIEAEVLLESWGLPLDPSDAGPIIMSMALLPTGEVCHSIIAS